MEVRLYSFLTSSSCEHWNEPVIQHWSEISCMILAFVVFHRMKRQLVSTSRRSRPWINVVSSLLVGSSAHLTSFYGTDTISGCILAHKYYLATEMAAFSIPASEHSTMVSWTRERERDAYENLLGLMTSSNATSRNVFFLLDNYPSGIVACVSDSYNIFHACEHVWGELLHDKVLARDGTLIIRSDSGTWTHNIGFHLFGAREAFSLALSYDQMALFF